MFFKYKKISKSDIIVFHQHPFNFELKKYVLDDLRLKYSVIDETVFNINPKIILKSIINLLFHLKTLKSFSDFKVIYFLSYIELHNSRVVITNIDNSVLFQKLWRLQKNIKYFAIQNGNRTKNELSNSNKMHLHNFFCFGKYDIDNFKRYGHTAEKFIPTGSLKSSIFIDKIKKKSQQKYDICLVSGWKDFLFDDNLDFSFQGMKNNFVQIDRFIYDYLKINNYKTVIAMRYGKEAVEYNYYKDYFGDMVELKDRIRPLKGETYRSYQAMYDSEVIISSCSTAAVEAFGMGKKVLLVDFSEDNRFANYEDGVWIVKENNYEVFKSKLDYLFNLNSADYKKETADYANYLMENEHTKPTYKKIIFTLKSSLNEKS